MLHSIPLEKLSLSKSFDGDVSRMYNRGYSTTHKKHSPKPGSARTRKKSEEFGQAPKQFWQRLQLKNLHSRIVTWGSVAGLSLGGIGMITLFWFNQDLPTPNALVFREKKISTRIMDRTNKVNLFEVYETQKRTPIPLSGVPQTLRWATLVAEDKNFYRHGGFSIQGMIRALIVDVLKGKKAQGGSTITQQLIKNALLSREKTLGRKAKELILAYKIERSFSKDEILEMYLNEIPYGGAIYGVEAASKTFFGKSANQLSLAQGAALAALPKAPSYYSPYGQHRDELLGRQQYILNQMEAEGYISPQERDLALQERLLFNPSKDRIVAPHFVMYVRELIADRFGETMLTHGGLTITTSLDMEKQADAEAAVSEGAERNEKNADAKNAALVALDPKNGEVLAMVGSRNYFDFENDGNVNVALRPRQPGSSFKPLVYLAAFQKGYTPNTILFDVETDFKTPVEGIYHPKNYNGQTYGPVTLRQALAGSLNIPSVKLLYLVGKDSVLDLADTLGYTTLKDRSRFGLSLVLGGGEVKLLEHVRAYAALAREGLLPELTPILKMTDTKGTILFEHIPKQGTRVLDDPEPIRELTSILTDREARRFIFGDGKHLILGNRPVAVKTGTTNDFRDAWTLGYTPSLVAGVWVGNNNNTPMKKGLSSMVAAPIWHSFMAAATKDQPIENFQAPKPIPLTQKPMLNGIYRVETEVPIDISTGKAATPETPPELISLRKENQVHTILQYIDRENPLGPAPKDPTQDEQYQYWETAVRAWAFQHGLISTQEQTKKDILTGPQVVITSPFAGASISEEQIPLLIQITPFENNPIERIEYLIDGNVIVTAHTIETSRTLIIPMLTGKKHFLTVRVIDSSQHTGTATIPLLFPNLPEHPFEWIKPAMNATFSSTTFPIPLILKVPPETEKTDYYIQRDSGKEWIGYSQEFSGSQAHFIWNDAPPAGRYSLSAIFTLKNGDIIASTELPVSIR